MGVVIAGAGLAGLTLASALGDQADVEVVDERPALGGGAGITLWPNALAALDDVVVEGGSLGDLVRDLGAPVDAGAVRRSDGPLVRRLDSRRALRALGEPARVVDRGDLQHALLEVVGTDRVRLGAAVRTIDDSGDGVAVGLAGGEQLRADALVGADGFRSVVARWLDPGLGSTYAGYTAIRGVADLQVEPTWHGVVWGSDSEAGLAPMTDGRTYWFATAAVPEVGAESPATVRRILDRLSTWAGPWREVVAATPGPLSALGLHDRDQPRAWSRDAVGVVGDAAHPMQPGLGQGGAQAIIDAVVLAGLWGGDPVGAFRELERTRRRRVTSLVASSRRLGEVLHRGRRRDRFVMWGAGVVPERAVLAGLRRVAGRG